MKTTTKPLADQPRAYSQDYYDGFAAGLQCASDYMKAQDVRTVNPEADPRGVWRSCCHELELRVKYGLLKPREAKK